MDNKSKILLLVTLFFSCFHANASEKNKEFIKAVNCAYDGNHAKHCKQIKPLSKIDQCPKEEFVQQGAISFGINNWSVFQRNKDRIQIIKNVVLLLLEKGCDIDKLDIRGISALQNSILLSNHDAIIFLLENGADPYKEVGISRSAKYKGRDIGLNSFDLIKRQHFEDKIFNNDVLADSRIYDYVQKKYPSELKPLKIEQLKK